MDRRRFLQALASLGMLAVSPARAQFNPKPRFAANPFALGIASGYPQPTGFSLWTRLAPLPDVPAGGMAPEIVPVVWEVASDEGFRDIAAKGTSYATPDWAHSVHVQVDGLQGNRP
jgi:alkaline phosphatase D